MNKVKQQHYVPRSYLRRWANSRDQIWVIDKSTQQAFETHVKNVAQERYFYDINPEHLKEPDDSQPGESLLQMVEGDFKEAVDELLGDAETVGIRPERVYEKGRRG
jgi:hypothetical protein